MLRASQRRAGKGRKTTRIVTALALATSLAFLAGCTGSSSTNDSITGPFPGTVPDSLPGADTAEVVPEAVSGALDGEATVPGAAARQTIQMADAMVDVDDVRVATDAITQAAVARGGYIENMQVSAASGQLRPENDGAWVSVRVPSEALRDMISMLPEVGDVQSTSISEQDVTSTVADLEGRIVALQASVDRLVALTARADTVADIIDVEAALAERQAELGSYQNQLDALSDSIALSTLSVSLRVAPTAVSVEPLGFVDGLTAGWSSMVGFFNLVVVAFGAMLPWLVLASIIAAVILVFLTRAKRRAARAAEHGGEGTDPDHNLAAAPPGS